MRVEGAAFESLKELLLDGSLNLGGLLSTLLAGHLTLLVFLVNGYHLLLGVHVRNAQFTLTNDHLMEFGEPLLALVALELCPEL